MHTQTEHVEFYQDWADALRSGDYTQAKGFLEELDGGNCCLGVALHLIGHQPEPLKGLPSGETPGESLVLSLAGEINIRPFAMINDNDGLTFDMIADTIEECFLPALDMSS